MAKSTSVLFLKLLLFFPDIGSMELPKRGMRQQHLERELENLCLNMFSALKGEMSD